MFSKFSVRVFQSSFRFHHSAALAMHSMHSRSPIEDSCRMRIARPSDTSKILKFMEKRYFCENSLSKCLDLCGAKLEASLENYLRSVLHQGISYIARDSAKGNKLIGVCLNQKNYKGASNHLEEIAENSTQDNTKKLLRIWALISREPDLHRSLLQNSIFDVSFVATQDDDEDSLLGVRLVKRSLYLARDMNFAYARANCTDNRSIKIAEDAKMIRLWDVKYKNILSETAKTPLVMPERPNMEAAVFYINLKMMHEEDDDDD